MSIDPSLLAVLACPVCGGKLALRGEDSLACLACCRCYPVREGIPVLLAEEAKEPLPKEECRAE